MPIHASLLPDGRALFFNSTGQVKAWDPVSGAATTATNKFVNVFCSGHTFMPDGRLFVAGGHVSDGVGAKTVCAFDYRSNTWSRLPDTNAGRWYPTAVTLANGDVLLSNGSIDNSTGVNRLQQVYEGSGAVRNLDNAWLYLPLYSYLHLAPNGKVFNSAPYQRSRYIDTAGLGSYSTVGDSSFGYRDAGTSVMYDTGKVLIVGGHDPPTETAEVIDLNQASPAWRSVQPLPTPRRHLNSTVLPDGKVLVTGGTRLSGFNNPEGAMLAGELWDPATEAWTTTAAMKTLRVYHSTSLLLPDGRVMCGGGGEYSEGDTTPHPNVEFYSPPYLFKGPRPTITACDSEIGYGQNFYVTTPDAASISAATIIRLGSVTHGFDMNQRLDRLTFTRASGSLTVKGPSSGKIAPPGHYLLFVLNGAGVPSVARIVRISGDPPPASPGNLNGVPKSSKSIALTWTDRSSDESGFRIESSIDGVHFGLRATVAANIVRYSDNGLAPGTQYTYRVTAFNGRGASSPSNPATVRTLTFDPAGTGLIGEYFKDVNFAMPLAARVDPQINFRWGTGSPAPGVNADNFSVRWRGEVQPRYSEAYTFRVVSDEAARLWVNGQLLIDDSVRHSERAAKGTLSLIAGRRYAICLELQEFTGNASCNLQWESASQVLERIPAQLLYPIGLIGSYFDNPDMTSKLLDRCDGPLDFAWGEGSPAPGVSAGTYSMRWIGAIQPPTSGAYTLTLARSGAVRLWLDGKLLINDWTDQKPGEVSASATLTAGRKHQLVVEYGETSGAGAVTLLWQNASVGKRVIPRANLLAN